MSHHLRLLKTQASQLIEHGKLTTTHARAQEVRDYLASLLKKIGKQNIGARRLLTASLFGKSNLARASDLSPETKIKLYRIGFRLGDRAALTQLVLEVPKKEISQTKNSKVARQKK